MWCFSYSVFWSTANEWREGVATAPSAAYAIDLRADVHV